MRVSKKDGTMSSQSIIPLETLRVGIGYMHRSYLIQSGRRLLLGALTPCHFHPVAGSKVGSGSQRKLSGGELRILAVSSGPGVHSNGKAWRYTGRFWHICHTSFFIGHCNVTVLVCMGTKAIECFLAWKGSICYKMQKLYSVTNANKGYTIEQVTAVAHWSSILLRPLRDNIKHFSKLLHPKNREAEGFILQFNHYWLRIALGVSPLHSSPSPHAGWEKALKYRAVGPGNGRTGESKRP